MQRIPPTNGHVARPWNDYLHPRNRTDGYRHAGVDIKGTGQVVAPISGSVAIVGLEGSQWRGYGPWIVMIKGPYYYHLLAHLSSVMVSNGQQVDIGDPIGTIDPSIGHVHWEVRTEKTREPNPWQKTIDPIRWLENKQIAPYLVTGKTPTRISGYPLKIGEKMSFPDPNEILERNVRQWETEARATTQKTNQANNDQWKSIALVVGGLGLVYLMLKK